MNPRRSALLAAASYPTVVLTCWAIVSLAGIASPRIESAGAAHIVDRLAPALAANVDFAAVPQASAAAAPRSDAAQAIAMNFAAPDTPEVAAAAELVAMAFADTKPVTAATAEAEPQPIVVAALSDPAEVLPAEIPPAQAPAASAADAPPPDAATTTAGRIELVGECLVAEPCIDQFLWALYQRTPKEDTIKEREQRKVQVKRKGKLVTVTRTFTKLVENDFTWKDPKAAERVGMSMMDYVIGGMDRSFKLKLFHMLYAAEAAGLQPGITSAFRDDYRQGIASGLKAASNRSYHGGSLRGGYGRGLAADIVSVNGANRAQRWTSTEAIWKWVDANGKQFGIGRPYLAYDPPHVGPIDGPEYASRRGSAKVAAADVKKHHRHAAHGKPAAAKRQVAARSPSGKPSRRVAEASGAISSSPAH
jgi:hypothetical protein